MKTKWLIGIAAAAALLAAGCIVSLTERVEVPLQGNVDFTDGLIYESVNLDDYDVTTENIKQIEKLQIEGIVENDLAREDTMNVYISANDTYRTRAAVEAATDVLAVLKGYVLPAGPSTVDTLTIKEADKLLQFDDANWINIKKLVMTGKFTAYLTSTGATAEGEILMAKLHITLTGKP